jgi:hypothetical protein
MSGQLHSLAAVPRRKGPLIRSKQASRRADLDILKERKNTWPFPGLIYLLVLSITHTIQHRMIQWLVNNELHRIYKAAVIDSSGWYSSICQGNDLWAENLTWCLQNTDQVDSTEQRHSVASRLTNGPESSAYWLCLALTINWNNSSEQNNYFHYNYIS